MKRKITCFLLIFIFSLLLVSCNNQGENSNSSSIVKNSKSEPITSLTPSSSSNLQTNSSSNSQNSSLDKYAGFSETEKASLIKADNVIDWQLDNGGWGKNYDTTLEFNGYPSDYATKVDGKFAGMIDNFATTTEMQILATAYDINPDQRYKDSFDKAFQFLKNLQYESGGFSQIYPHNGKYNDLVTYNDYAMTKVLTLLDKIAKDKKPYRNITSIETKQECSQMVEKGVDYILKSQIEINGEKAGWCAQHDPITYEPKMARSYELASISGAESVGIIEFLLTQTDNQEALDCAESARLWLKSKRLENTVYVRKDAPNSFQTKQGSYVWYRFYDLQTGEGFFCTRSGQVYYEYLEFCEADKNENDGVYERAVNYDWAGSWLDKKGLNY